MGVDTMGTKKEKMDTLRDTYKSILEAKKPKIKDNNDVIIDCSDLNREWQNINLLHHLIDNFIDINLIFHIIVNEIVGDYVKYIRYANIPETNIENLMSDQIGRLTSTKGTITAVYPAKARLTKAVYECNGCMRLHLVENDGKGILPPTLCNECGGRSFTFKEDESTYETVKEFVLGQNIEEMQGNTQPRKIKCTVAGANNYINNIRVGAKVKVTGILRIQAEKESDLFNYEYSVNHIENTDDNTIKLTKDEKERLEKIAKNKLILNILIDSFAPNLILSKELKLSLLCFLVGSTPINDIKPMIHILIMSDPATAKSKIKQEIYKLSEKCMRVSGTGASAVGISGAIDTDEITKQKVLRAGAIPLAHNGHCIIDEIDKMDKEDCTRANNYMEDGYDNYNKAGLNETLIGETSILALGNPKYGRYDPYKSLGEQINVEPSFLSRFDLKFLIRDVPDETNDREILARMFDPDQNTKTDEQMNSDDLKKYISYARNEYTPTLRKDAQKYATEHILERRKNGEYDFRAGRSIIKLAGAIAKLRLKKQITVKDIKMAIKLQDKSLSEFGIDPVTKEYDMSRYYGTPNQADKRNRNNLLQIIKEYTEQNETESIPAKELEETFHNRTKLGKQKYYDTLKQLKNNGDIKQIGRGQNKGYGINQE